MNAISSVQLNSCQSCVQANDPGSIGDGVCRKQTEQAQVGVHFDALPPVPGALHHLHVLNDCLVHPLVPVCQVGVLQQRCQALQAQVWQMVSSAQNELTRPNMSTAHMLMYAVLFVMLRLQLLTEKHGHPMVQADA